MVSLFESNCHVPTTAVAMDTLSCLFFLVAVFCMSNGFLLETDTLLTSPLLSNFLIGKEAWQNQDTSILSSIYKQAR